MTRLATARSLATSLLALALASGARAQVVDFIETWVEPDMYHCDAERIFPWAFSSGTGTENDQDLDRDGLFEGDPDEDTDEDPIFSSIQAAIDHTLTGGIVHIPAGGVYREELTITDSITLRGRLDGRVVLDGTCGSLNTGIDVTGEDKKVRIENLTIRGYDIYGIDCDDSNLTVVNTRIENCATGIAPPNVGLAFTLLSSHLDGCSAGLAGSGSWQVADCVFEHCGTGIAIFTYSGDASLSISGTKVLRSDNVGISMVSETGGVFTLTAHACQVSGSGARGIQLSASEDSSLRVTASLVEGNGSDGIFVENIDGCVTGVHRAEVVIADSRIEGNAGDGLEILGSGSACGDERSVVKAAIIGNSIAMNGAYGIRGDTDCEFACGVGENQISYNVSGAESSTGGPYCTLSDTNNNQGS